MAATERREESQHVRARVSNVARLSCEIFARPPDDCCSRLTVHRSRRRPRCRLQAVPLGIDQPNGSSELRAPREEKKEKLNVGSPNSPANVSGSQEWQLWASDELV